MEGSVQLNINNNIGTIEFYHPQSNSLPSNILEKLAKTIEECGNNDNISVIILKSKGDRVFCAGASFDELSSISNFKEGKSFFMGFANVINACRKCPKLIICRVQGKAVGGGVGMGIRKSDADLRDKFTAAIDSMKADGTLNALIIKHEIGETF